jgi:hypothetical protein
MNREDMEAIVQGVATKSEKIRLLHAAGAKRADIARFLEIRYQHVYNVLKDRGGRDEVNEVGAPSDPGQVSRARVEAGSKIALPREFVEAEGLRAGDEVICRRDPDGIKIMSRAAVQEQLKAVLRQRLPEQADLLEAVLASEERPRSR